jgi:peptidoglycan/LPS O-acetylase OafA/YrhL
MQEIIKGFDGVRAIAVVLVYINHKVALPGTDLGNLRIRIFFALSGFLIIGILARRRECIEAGNSTIGAEIRTFYWRRSLRIFPLYYTVLTIFGVLHVLGYFYDHEAGIPWRFAYLSNVIVGRVGTWPGPFDHFWTLAVEEQFCLFSAPLLLAIPVPWHFRICLVITAGGFATLLGMATALQPVLVIKTSSAANFASLAVGGIAYFVYRDRQPPGRRHLIAFLLFALLAAVCLGAHPRVEDNNMLAAAFAQIAGTVAAAFVIGWLSIAQSSRIVRALEGRWLVEVGIVSYGVYVLHLFLIYLASSVDPLLPSSLVKPCHLVRIPSVFVLSVGVAMLSRHYLEEPFLRLKTIAPVRRRPFVR